MSSKPEPRIYNPSDSVTQADITIMLVDPIQTAPEENYINDPGDARYFGVFVGFLVVFLGIAGNGVTVWAYIRNKNLQTSFNVLIANLCLVDLIFSVVVISLILPGYIVGINIYSDVLCSMIGYLYYVSLTSSLYNLVAIAVNRYVGIVKSEHYQKLFTGRRLAMCIASVWLVPAMLYIPVVTGGAIKWTSNTLRCAIGGDIPSTIKWYNLALDVTFQAVPLLVLIILYTAIFKKVKQVKQKMKGHQKVSKTNSKLGRMPSASGSVRFKSGNTSEDTGDEFKPSSLLEGLSLKPVQTSIDKNLNHESSEILSKNGDETEDEEKSTDDPLKESLTPSVEDNLNNMLKDCTPRKKRSSIWTMLWRNNQKLDYNQAYSPCNKKSEKNTPDSEKLEKDKAENSTIELRRKKSLSTSNLPNTNFPTLERLAVENGSSLKRICKTPEPHPANKEEKQTLNLKRCHSVYDRSPLHREKELETLDNKQKMAWSVRIKRNTIDWASSCSLSKMENELQKGRTRFGTIARKVQERKANEAQRDKKRQRKRRIMRKKHARERQLVYSSFTICIAFALCIMPTAILYLIQVFSGQQAPASANLIVGCVAWIHAVVNPMIYGYLNSQYRKEYSKIAQSISYKLTCRQNFSRGRYR